MRTTKDYELQTVCGEPLLIPVEEDGKSIINLDEISAYLWQRAEKAGNFTLETLIGFLMEEYEVDETTAREDCAEIVEAWFEMGIVTE